MTTLTVECPSCGAAIAFRWAQAVQTVCAHCRSVLVRHDNVLERLGQVSELPGTASPIQLGTTGRWRDRPFVIIGRLAYEYGRGQWNEWHALMRDGTSAWLADAQLEFTMTAAADPTLLREETRHLRVGASIIINQTSYAVRSVTHAHYLGVEGELPFVYWDKAVVPFIDCWTTDGRFATIDHSETPPLLFLGDAVDVADLQLSNLRAFDGW